MKNILFYSLLSGLFLVTACQVKEDYSTGFLATDNTKASSIAFNAVNTVEDYIIFADAACNLATYLNWTEEERQQLRPKYFPNWSFCKSEKYWNVVYTPNKYSSLKFKVNTGDVVFGSPGGEWKVVREGSPSGSSRDELPTEDEVNIEFISGEEFTMKSDKILSSVDGRKNLGGFEMDFEAIYFIGKYHAHYVISGGGKYVAMAYSWRTDKQNDIEVEYRVDGFNSVFQDGNRLIPSGELSITCSPLWLSVSDRVEVVIAGHSHWSLTLNGEDAGYFQDYHYF